MQGFIAIQIKARQLSLPRAVVDPTGGLQLRRESYGFGVEADDVARGRAINAQVKCAELALAKSEIARVQVDLRAVRCAHIEVNLSIDALQGHAVVMNALAMRAQSERRHASRSAERTVCVQLAAAGLRSWDEKRFVSIPELSAESVPA